jgi:hypothetical protein
MIVHDVEVHDVGARVENSRNVFAQPGEISRKNGGSD